MDTKKQRQHLRDYTDAARQIELAGMAILILEGMKHPHPRSTPVHSMDCPPTGGCNYESVAWIERDRPEYRHVVSWSSIGPVDAERGVDDTGASALAIELDLASQQRDYWQKLHFIRQQPPPPPPPRAPCGAPGSVLVTVVVPIPTTRVETGQPRSCRPLAWSICQFCPAADVYCGSTPVVSLGPTGAEL